MKLDKVTVLRPATYGEQPPRVWYERAKGYDLVATAIGVVVTRLPDCMVPVGRDEPTAVLVPWPMVAAPCDISPEQPKK